MSRISISNRVEVLAEIDRIAFTMVRDVNAIHKRGLTLEGENGGDFFQSLKLNLDPSGANMGAASAELRVIDPDQIPSETVTFSYDADANIWNGVSTRNGCCFRQNNCHLWRSRNIL